MQIQQYKLKHNIMELLNEYSIEAIRTMAQFMTTEQLYEVGKHLVDWSIIGDVETMGSDPLKRSMELCDLGSILKCEYFKRRYC